MSEHYLTGYCRCLDSARVVEVVIENDKLDDCDCLFGNCKFQMQCPVAQKIEELISE